MSSLVFVCRCPPAEFGRITQDMVAKRFSSDANTKVERMDMLQSFIKHGLDEDEAVSESLIQMYVSEILIAQTKLTGIEVLVGPTHQLGLFGH